MSPYNWPVQAREFYQQFLERVRTEYQGDRIKDGVFGAMMNVSLVNDVRPSFLSSISVHECLLLVEMTM